MLAFFLGFLLDQLLGDPQGFPHPVRLIGRLVSWTEGALRGGGEEVRKETAARGKKEEVSESEEGRKETAARGKKEDVSGNGEKRKREFWQGAAMAAATLALTTAVSSVILLAAYGLHSWAGVLAEAWMTYRILAAKSLRTESMKVHDALARGDLESAREAVSMIVGRDTDVLGEEGVAKAAVETVAENTVDGVIAPMLFTAIGGPALGFFYKAANTMDSMVGYRNEKYLYFGRAAAKLDDFLNFIPARVGALLLVAAAFLGGLDVSGKRAYVIYRRDGRKHASPNSAQAEAACAGALGVCLAGDAWYFGKLEKKPEIGEGLRAAEPKDIWKGNGKRGGLDEVQIGGENGGSEGKQTEERDESDPWGRYLQKLRET